MLSCWPAYTFLLACSRLLGYMAYARGDQGCRRRTTCASVVPRRPCFPSGFARNLRFSAIANPAPCGPAAVMKHRPANFVFPGISGSPTSHPGISHAAKRRSPNCPRWSSRRPRPPALHRLFPCPRRNIRSKILQLLRAACGFLQNLFPALGCFRLFTRLVPRPKGPVCLAGPPVNRPGDRDRGSGAILGFKTAFVNQIDLGGSGILYVLMSGSGIDPEIIVVAAGVRTVHD